MQRGLTIFIILILLSIGFESFAQCAMCKAVAEDAGAEQVEGVNAGILYLMTIPYLLIGTIAFIIFKNKKSNA